MRQVVLDDGADLEYASKRWDIGVDPVVGSLRVVGDDGVHGGLF